MIIERANLHGPKKGNRSCIIDHAFPKHQRVEKWHPVLFKNLQDSNTICCRKNDTQCKAVLQE